MDLGDAGWSYDPEEVEGARRAVLRFREEAVSAYELDNSRLYLMGFSQGGAMSVLLALTEPKRWSGIMAMSGALLPEADERMAESKELEGLPVLAIHGTRDEVVPVAIGRVLRDRLERLPVRLTYREYPMGHEITPECLNDLTRWLTARLDETG
jgi:phospholipase/carboxylesterase